MLQKCHQDEIEVKVLNFESLKLWNCYLTTIYESFFLVFGFSFVSFAKKRYFLVSREGHFLQDNCVEPNREKGRM